MCSHLLFEGRRCRPAQTPGNYHQTHHGRAGTEQVSRSVNTREERVTAKSVLYRDRMDAGQSKHKGGGGINHAHGDDCYSPARQNTRCSVVYCSAEAHISTKPQPWQGEERVVTSVLGMCRPSLQYFSDVVRIKDALGGKKCHLWQWGNISNYLNLVHTWHISRIVKRGKRDELVAISSLSAQCS